MHRNILALAALAGGALAAATPVAAQEIEHRANTRGLFINGHLNGSSAKYDNPSTTESGGGGGFQVGYGINRNFTVYVGYDGSRLDFASSNLSEPGEFSVVFEDKYWLKQLELGARWNFVSPVRTWVPYVDLAFTRPSGGSNFSIFPDDDEDPSTPPEDDDGVAGRDDSVDGEFELEDGSAFTVGGGITWFFSQKLALDVNVKYSGVKFDGLKLSAGGLTETGDEDTKFGLTRVNFGLSWYPLIGR